MWGVFLKRIGLRAKNVSAWEPVSKRLSKHASPNGKRGKPRGSKDKNVGCNSIAPIKLIIRRNIDCALRGLRNLVPLPPFSVPSFTAVIDILALGLWPQSQHE